MSHDEALRLAPLSARLGDDVTNYPEIAWPEAEVRSQSEETTGARIPDVPEQAVVYISKLVEVGGREVVFRHGVSDPGVTLVLSQRLDDESWTAELTRPDGWRKELPVRMNVAPE